MALILAVEPDPRQAANITGVLRARPRTELVIADSAVRALETLANRVPDVLLTSPLLSRQDERALADWLRDLGAAAAHVQELTIPILASSAAAPQKKRGVLASLRRDRPNESQPDGCEPDMFAEQISVYAERASAGRKYEAPPPVELILLAPTERELVATVPEPVSERFTDELTIPLVFDLPVRPAVEAKAIPTPRVVVAKPESVTPKPKPVVARPAPVVAQPVAPVPPAERIVVPAEKVIRAPKVGGDDESWLPVELDKTGENAPRVPEDLWVLGPIYFDDVVRLTAPSAQPPAGPAPAPAEPQPSVSFLSLDRSSRTQPTAAASSKKTVRPKATPVQDEWGLFDPAQCGFAALLAKLDEITEHKDAHERRAGTTVRILAY